MRERTFKIIGLPHSSPKIWRLQNEANKNAKHKNKNKKTDNYKIHHDFVERLTSSHDITLRFGKTIEEIFLSLDKVSNHMLYLLENTNNPSYNDCNLNIIKIIYFIKLIYKNN